MARYYIALGSNLPGPNGESPESNVLSAMDSIKRLGGQRFQPSDLYETAPVPISDQPWYVNAVVAYDSEMPPLRLLRHLQQIEASFGRVRSVANAARTLDLDIVAIEGGAGPLDDAPVPGAAPKAVSPQASWAVIDHRDLQVPHPRMHLRAFVLDPLLDVNPNWQHPLLRQTAQELRAALDAHL